MSRRTNLIRFGSKEDAEQFVAALDPKTRMYALEVVEEKGTSGQPAWAVLVLSWPLRELAELN